MTAPYPPPSPSDPLFVGRTYGKAWNAFWLGLSSLVCCGLFTGIPAIIVGARALGHIDASQGRLTGKGTAWAGIILGIVGTFATTGAATYYQSTR